MTLTSSFFDKISFLDLGDEGKEEVAQKVIEDIETNKLYRLELVLSCAIATFGLLINSTPVVIGAMLIAPILRPIQAFAFAISTGNKGIYTRALGVLVMSIIVTASVSFLLTYMVPFAEITSEIQARIAPTILDLLIAFASGAVAFLSLGFKKLSESLAGVAMAASLIPPLCVTGIGLNMFLLDVAQGSALLFLANLVAIIVIGICIFYAYGFFPTNGVGQKNSLVQIGLILISVVLVAVPLRGTMEDITANVSTQRIIHQTIESFLPRISSSLRVQDMSYTFGDNQTDVSLSLKVPENTIMTQLHQQELTTELSRTLQTNVNLSVELIPVTSVALEPIPQEIPIDIQLQNAITTFLGDQYEDIFLLRLDYSPQNETLISLSLYNQGDRQNTEDMKQGIQLFLQEEFEVNYRLLLSLQQQTIGESEQQKLLRNSLLEKMPAITLASFSVMQEEREILQTIIVPQTGNTLTGTMLGTGAIRVAESIQENQSFGPDTQYETNIESVIVVSVRFSSDSSVSKNKAILFERKEDLEKELGMSVLIEAELSLFNTISL